MATVTIRAADAAQALDEVMRCLGPDALILSTRNHKGQVEVVAAPAGGLSPAAPAMAEPPAVVPGFSGHLLRQLARSPARYGVLPPHLPGRVVLVGPPGAGRSTLAARLAAEAMRTPGAARPMLVAPRPDLLAAPGRLAAHARLLGLVVHRPVWRPGSPAELAAPGVDETQIIDLSDLPQAEPSQLSEIAVRADTAIWLVLPAGLHPDLLERLCARFCGLASHVVLTRTDLCAPTADDLRIPPRHDLAVSLLSGGAGLIDTLQPAGPAGLATPNAAPDAAPRAADVPPHATHPEEMPDASPRLS